MYKPEITRLYHYQSIELTAKSIRDFEQRAVQIGEDLFIDKYRLEPILGRKAYFSKPNTFNDPFEAVFDLSINDGDTDDLIKLLDLSSELLNISIPDVIRSMPREKIRKQLDDSLIINPKAITNLFTKKIREEIGLYCLTPKPTDMLMWAHYGSNHSGIALEFNRTPESNCGTMTFEVTYFTSPPQISFGEVLTDFVRLYEAKCPVEKSKIVEKSSIRKLLYSKTNDWEGEGEWRTNHLPGLQDMPGELVSIIFGHNTNQKVIEYLMSRKELAGISFKFITLNKSNYQLDVHERQPFFRPRY